jgi:LAS superfamily LD-carboxypeptidase LdcB
LRELQQLLAKFFVDYAGPLTVTSGLRSMAKHKQIYANINAARGKQGLQPLAVPMASKHLYGLAVDIADAKGELKKWIIAHVKRAEELGLYFEDFGATKTWAHIQCRSPRSGNRFFKP